VRVKICGVTRPADARLAVRLGAWAVGMIFVPETPRFLTLAAARRVRAAIPKGVLAVGVFRDPSREELLRAVRELRLDAVQVYGKLPTGLRAPAFIAGRSKLGPLDYAFLEPERTDADRRAGRGPSARAQRAAWKASAAKAKKGVRVILAGGLTPKNAAQAAAAAKPWALDVSSGVERRPGAKDPALLRAFFAAVK
jgi:phosphoribosylanthranilate isomerase